MLTATVTTTHEAALAPALKRRLRTELLTYLELQDQIKALKQAAQCHANACGTILTEAGETSIDLDGYKATWVNGVSTRLDKMKLLEAGVSMAQIEGATVTTPKKAYVKITAPGQGKNGDNE